VPRLHGLRIFLVRYRATRACIQSRSQRTLAKLDLAFPLSGGFEEGQHKRSGGRHAAQVKGKVKEQVGKTTNNPRLQNEGADEKLSGKVQKKVGQVEKVLEG
jgi:uncharacterized protein YjbJ (UPF0337 family)